MPRRPTALAAAVAVSLALAGAALQPAVARDGPSAGAERFPLPMPRPASLDFGTDRLCDLIADAADRHRLPPEFFARLIWKESRFDILAVSPAGAEGVAQFMPETARIRGLVNAFDPRHAIPASASFLADLRRRFGNLGLAAAAYNGGPGRVAAWLARDGGLPGETIDYVHSITYRPVEWFRKPGREVERRPLEEGLTFEDACRKLPVIATRAVAGPARAPWGVQIAAGISHRAALTAFSRARSQIASLVGAKQAIVVRSRLVGGRRLYSARVGAQSRGEAQRLCARIRRVGGTCVVRRN